MVASKIVWTSLFVILLVGCESNSPTQDSGESDTHSIPIYLSWGGESPMDIHGSSFGDAQLRFSESYELWIKYTDAEVSFELWASEPAIQGDTFARWQESEILIELEGYGTVWREDGCQPPRFNGGIWVDSLPSGVRYNLELVEWLCPDDWMHYQRLSAYMASNYEAPITTP